MANSLEIKGRMKSIKDTMKITNAMYMISSSKLQKAKKNLKNTEPYFYTLQDTLAQILEAAPEMDTRYFDRRDNIPSHMKKDGCLLITADKGMAGAYNHNIIKIADAFTKDPKDNKLFVVGMVGRQYFEKKNIPIDISFKYTAQNPTVNRARHIAERMIDMYMSGEVDEVFVVYTKMINSVEAKPEIKRILPLEKLAIKHRKGKEGKEKYSNDYVSFLPDPATVFEHIVPDYITGFIYGALVESYCAEHNSRMMAMQTATDAAKDMLRNLSVEYNRARQAAITQEITEVVAGSKAQKKSN